MQPKRNKPTLKQLQAKWYRKLKQSGFKDIEKSNQQLVTPDSRTAAFENRDEILNFFLRLDEYLATTELQPLHRKILELYTQGIYQNEIARRVKRDYSRVKQIISYYKKIIITGDY